MPIGDGVRSGNQARHDHVERGRSVGFLTDPTLCIGCKACEVACKEWNQLPDEGARWLGHSYDHTGALGASTWRHVKFVEQDRAAGLQIAGPMGGAGGHLASAGVPAGSPAHGGAGPEAYAPDAFEDPFRWVFLSDVCKHCEHAGCLEACPTGAIIRTEVGSVFVQDDVCNGCGYCVVGCPFGVIDRRPEPLPGAGGAFKCTFCYDRQSAGLTPACAKACPTEAIRFGPLDELREEARERVETLRERGYADAALYDPRDTSVGGAHALFVVLGEPESYGLPPAPEVPTVHLRAAWGSALATALGALMAALAALAIWGTA